MDVQTTIEREENASGGRFILKENGVEAGDMTFTWHGDDGFIIDHTTVGEDFGGKGYGRVLVNAGVAYARETQKKITPHCPYAKRVLEGDAQYTDVLA